MPELYLGLISGTSADGIDVALASFARRPKLLASLTYPYPEPLRRRILALAQGEGLVALDEFGALDVEIARAFAAAATELLQRESADANEIRALGSHGQTVRHRPQFCAASCPRSTDFRGEITTFEAWFRYDRVRAGI